MERNPLRDRLGDAPKIAIVLGTGLGETADRFENRKALNYGEIPGFPVPTALAHRGRLVVGEYGGTQVAALQGRCHLYEGRSIGEITRPIRALAEWGVTTIVLTNAAGGLNPSFRAGDVMLLEDHVNLTFARPWLAPDGGESLQGRPVYDGALQDAIEQVAIAKGVPLRRGVYIGVTGPNYETRAEYRMMRRLGGDAVGMSTVFEALAACSLGMRVAAFSAITNVAKPDAPDVVDAQEVVDVATCAAPRIEALFEGLCRTLS